MGAALATKTAYTLIARIRQILGRVDMALDQAPHFSNPVFGNH